MKEDRTMTAPFLLLVPPKWSLVAP